MNKRWVRQIAAAISLAALAPAGAADKPYDGVTLTLASQNDQFATVLADLSPKFQEATGITVKVDILSYTSTHWRAGKSLHLRLRRIRMGDDSMRLSQ